MKVPYLDLRIKEKAHREALHKRLEGVLTHGRIIEGPEVQDFEQRIAQRVGTRFAVGLALEAVRSIWHLRR